MKCQCGRASPARRQQPKPLTKAQTERLEKSLADGEIRAWDIPASLELREVCQSVRRGRVALGHAPSAADIKALAAKITRAIRDRAGSPRGNVPDHGTRQRAVQGSPPEHHRRVRGHRQH